MNDFQHAKSMAVILRAALKSKDWELSHSEALEIVAKQFGFSNWNILSSKIEKSKGTPGPHYQDVVPIIRIFDVTKAIEFYTDFLDFKVDWQHTYGDNFPVYMQLSNNHLTLHLSEHSGDAAPGSNAVVYMNGIRQLERTLTARQYKYMKPKVVEVDGRLELEVIDPFSNRLRFIEVLHDV